MQPFMVPSQRQIDALKKAAHAAQTAGDLVHAEALWKAAKFEERRLREHKAGVDGSIVAFIMTAIDDIIAEGERK